MIPNNTKLIGVDFDLKIDTYHLRVRQIKFETESDTSKPTLVFLHDSLGCITLWRDFPEQLALATGCQALIYDRQGYGLSSPFTQNRSKEYLEKEADLLARIFEKCNIKQAILFGHSDGGSISLIAAAKFPHLIRAIITEGAHVFVEEITLDGIRKAVEAYQTTPMAAKLAKYHGDKTDAVFKAWTETWLSADFRDWNIEHFLPKITCPTLVLQGTEDEYGTIKQVEAITTQISNKTQAKLIQGAAHTPHKEAREETLLLTAQFINR